jgi:peptide/nickel transport system substrate-binding protein
MSDFTTNTRRRFLQTTLAASGVAAAGLTWSPGTLRAQAETNTLRIGATGGTTDSLDPHRNQGQTIDIMRFMNLFDGLTEYNADASTSLSLAESITPNDTADEWTVKLHDGILCHDGSQFTTADVLFSIKRILDAANPTKGAGLISFVDPAKIEIVDGTTMIFRLDKPYGPFREIWSNRYLRMVPQNFDPKTAIGTGAYKMVSFTPGQESTFEAFDGYFRGAPSIERVQISDIVETAAQINALRSGQVDVAFDIPLAEARVIDADPSMTLLNNPSGMSILMYMRVDKEPFDDPKVREAFRLIADRQQIVNVALSGYGEVGNDMQGRSIAPCSSTDVPQRTQDIEKAKALLEEAGQSGMKITLNTVAGTTGMVECAQVFAEQAKAAGITVEVANLDLSSYLANYGEWTFGVDFLTDSYLSVVARSLIKGGAFNNTHWNDEEFTALYEEAVSTADESKRCAIINQMREIEYKRGGNLVWGFANMLNAYNPALKGAEPYVLDSSFYNVRRLSFA